MAVVPNLLSCLRIVLALALPFLPRGAWLPVVVAAGVSDLLDGVIAHRFHATSALGGLLDGIADKLFTVSAVLTFAAAGLVPAWQGVLVMARDLTVTALALWAAGHREWAAFRKMAPRSAGKVTTALVFPWFVLLLVSWGTPFRFPVFAVAAGCSLYAAGDYVRQFRHAHRRWRAGTLFDGDQAGNAAA